MTQRLAALDLLDLVLDTGSFARWDGAPLDVQPDPAYAARADHAPQMAAAQGVRSLDLLANGVVDRVVPERPDAADEREEFCRRMGQVLQHELAGLLRRPAPERRAARLDRYRRLGL